MRKFPILFACLLLAISTQVYGGSQDKPSQINTNGWADSPFITPDGENLVFMYSRYNFFPALLGTGMPEIRGPDRPHHHKSSDNPYAESDIYISRRLRDGAWSAPRNLVGVNDGESDCCAMLVKGQPTRIYYQRDTGTNGRDLVYREQTSVGWGPVIFFPSAINSPSNEENIHVSGDHKRAYFTSDRPGGYGGRDIWFSYLDEAGKWSEAINLGPAINTAEDEDQFWIAEAPGKDGVFDVYFNRTSSQIWHSGWSAQNGFLPAARVDLGLDYVGEASVTADGKTLVFASGDPATQTIRIMLARRNKNGSWGTPLPVD